MEIATLSEGEGAKEAAGEETVVLAKATLTAHLLSVLVYLGN